MVREFDFVSWWFAFWIYWFVVVISIAGWGWVVVSIFTIGVCLRFAVLVSLNCVCWLFDLLWCSGWLIVFDGHSFLWVMCVLIALVR